MEAYDRASFLAPDDLAVSAPFSPVNSIEGAGAVDVYMGGPSGLAFTKILHQDVPDRSGSAV